MNLKSISKEKNDFEKVFSFCSLVTRLDEYKEMVESAKSAGFTGEDVEFLYLDNSQENICDGFSGFNRFLLEAKGKYLIYCHQDILFEFDKRSVLEDRISEISEIDPKWSILGNAGKAHNSLPVARITDPNADNITLGDLPGKVMTVDENFLVINRSNPTVCSGQMSGFHLYATDLCQNAEYLGYSCYVVDFHLRHKSGGNADESYNAVQHKLMELYRERKKPQVIQAMCSRFYVSSSRILMNLFNNNKLLNLHKSLKKKYLK